MAVQSLSNEWMSTGSDLLLQLRRRRQRQKSGNLAVKEKKDIDTHYKTSKSTTSSSETIIEVCLGPDCSGGGGGAALLEIEELVSCSRGTSVSSSSYFGNNRAASTNKKIPISVVPGGCTDHCTMGPNVHVISSNSRNDTHHYNKVNNPQACRNVVASIYADGKEEEEVSAVTETLHVTSKTTSPPMATDNNSSVTSLLKRRDDATRWRSHKERAARERRLKVRER